MICVCLFSALAFAGGLALAGGASSAGLADEPGPTTTAPAPEPTPDPAPAPAPPPKASPPSKPKPAPTPVSHPSVRRPTPTPTPSSVIQARPTSVRPHPTVQPTIAKPVVKKRIVHKKAPASRKVEAQPLPQPNTSLGDVLGAAMVVPLKPNDSVDFRPVVIALMLALAIVCLGIAAIPAVYVPWRPVAYFIAQRHLDMAIAGLACLVLAGFLMVVAGGG